MPDSALRACVWSPVLISHEITAKHGHTWENEIVAQTCMFDSLFVVRLLAFSHSLLLELAGIIEHDAGACAQLADVLHRTLQVFFRGSRAISCC